MLTDSQYGKESIDEISTAVTSFIVFVDRHKFGIVLASFPSERS
jgi:hypothetical protein